MTEDEIETWLNHHLARWVDFEPRVAIIRIIMANFELAPKLG